MDFYNRILQCPNCLTPQIDVRENAALCNCCRSEFVKYRGRLVLLPSKNVFSPDAYSDDATNENYFSSRNLIGWLSSLLPKLSVNLSSRNNLKSLNGILKKDAKVLIVGSGKQRRYVVEMLNKIRQENVICIDVDKNADVDFFADATCLPFVNSSFDCVITTAVLQHVSEPSKAVKEIERVLTNSGLVYSEYAFLQQVIEGGYDFSRLTITGHRLLFSDFTEIGSGVVAGPATVFLWSLENLFLSLSRNKLFRLFSKALIRLAFFWLKYLDYLLVYNSASLDNCSCTYFLGVKENKKRSVAEVINSYNGAKIFNHY